MACPRPKIPPVAPILSEPAAGSKLPVELRVLFWAGSFRVGRNRLRPEYGGDEP